MVLAGLCLAGCGPGALDAVRLDPGTLAVDQVAHWTFDEGTGTTANDISGNGHHGQLIGGSWTTDGKFGGALELARGDYVMVPNFPQAKPSWTVSVWLRMSPEQLAIGQADNDWVTIISTENVFSGGWQLHVDHRPGVNRFDAAYWVGPSKNDYKVADCQCIDVDIWTHLTAVFDGAAGRLSLYRDDIERGWQDMPIPIRPGDSTLYMGTWNMMMRFLTARIDDFTIWSRALRPAEISLLSLRPAPTSP